MNHKYYLADVNSFNERPFLATVATSLTKPLANCFIFDYK